MTKNTTLFKSGAIELRWLDSHCFGVGELKEVQSGKKKGETKFDCKYYSKLPDAVERLAKDIVEAEAISSLQGYVDALQRVSEEIRGAVEVKSE